MRWKYDKKLKKEEKKLPPEGKEALDEAKRTIEGAKNLNEFINHQKVRKMAGTKGELDTITPVQVGPRNDNEVYKRFKRRFN